MLYANGDIYIGSWRQNKKHGKGRLIKPKRDIMDGIWSQDRFWEGLELKLEKRGWIEYRNEWKGGFKHGKCKEYQKTGIVTLD